MLGKKLFAPTELNKAFKRGLGEKEWGKPDRYSFYMNKDENVTRQLLELPIAEQKVLLDALGEEPWRSYNEADFYKNRVSLEVQFGKYAFVQFDLFVKHAANFMQNKIDLGIEIVPMKAMEREMSSGPPAYEKHLHEILR